MSFWWQEILSEGDALDMLRMRRQAAMDRNPQASPVGDEPAPDVADPIMGGEDEPGFGGIPHTGWRQTSDAGSGAPGNADDADMDWFRRGNWNNAGGWSPDDDSMGEDMDAGFNSEPGDMPNRVEPHEAPEPDAEGGYTEEPVEMPWSGHAVRGNADFGADHDTEESTIIDPGEGEEFKGSHPDKYEEASEEEGFGEEPED